MTCTLQEPARAAIVGIRFTGSAAAAVPSSSTRSHVRSAGNEIFFSFLLFADPSSVPAYVAALILRTATQVNLHDSGCMGKGERGGINAVEGRRRIAREAGKNRIDCSPCPCCCFFFMDH